MLVPVGWGWDEGPAVYESDKLVGVSPCGLVVGVGVRRDQLCMSELSWWL